jgi:TonB-dependent receptor
MKILSKKNNSQNQLEIFYVRSYRSQIFKLMKKQLLLIALTIFASFSLKAQTGSVRGRVIDSNNLPLPGASVYTPDKSVGTITDVNGNYTITGLKTGDYTLMVSYIGFEQKEEKVSITKGKTQVLDFIMEPGIGIEEVTITSALQGQSKALNQQKNKANISNIIASDQIGKFPDVNIGDALKRIPGINVQYDQGEARFGNIRGTAPEYNSVTINGERIPSAEAEDRSIQLDLIPSDMIQMVEVNKAITPDMDADAIGGSINLVTISEPYEKRISGSLGTGYNFLADKPTVNGSLIYGNRFANNKIGMILSASYHDNQLGSDNVEAEWDHEDGNVFLKEKQVRQYYLQRIRQSYSAAFDFKLNNDHTLFFKGIYNKRADWENRYRNVFKPWGEPIGGIHTANNGEPEDSDDFDANKIERETKAGINSKDGRLEDQRMMQFALSGDHLFGKAKVDWGVSYSKASEDRPQERYLNMVIEDEDINYDISDPEYPLMWLDASSQDLNDNWELDELTEENQYTEDIDLVARLNIEIPLAEGNFKNSIKFGGKYKSKSKKRDNNFFEYEATDSYEDDFNTAIFNNLSNQSKSDFMPGSRYQIGHFVSKEFLGGLNFNDASKFSKEEKLSEYAGNFDASETVTAGYLMLNQKLGHKLSVILGLRIEHTNSENEGFSYDDEEETLDPTEKIENDYTNVLPNFHLRYDISKNSIVRIAYTSSLARPRYFDLVPYTEIEDGEEISIGNPNLEPTTSNNFDLMAEHYFKSIGIVSGGFFYKDIKDFIVNERHGDYEYDGTVWSKFKQPINGGDAKLWGLEFAAQRQLDFLPGFLKGFGIYTNYTYTTSEITDFNIEDREGEDLKLPGTPEHTLNASLSYDTKKFTGRLSFNYASDFVSEFDDEAFKDIYYDQVTYLDLNLTYSFNKHYLIYADVKNLLNQPLRYYQGSSERTYQAEYYGATFRAGVKINF